MEVDVTREARAGRGHEVAEDGEHGDAAVLDLDGAEAVEALLVGVGEEAERVPEAERRLGADLALEGHLHGAAATRGLEGLRGERGGGRDERKGGDGAEHFSLLVCERRSAGGARERLVWRQTTAIHLPSTKFGTLDPRKWGRQGRGTP